MLHKMKRKPFESCLPALTWFFKQFDRTLQIMKCSRPFSQRMIL